MAAHEARIPLSELAPLTGSLEDAFLAVTGGRRRMSNLLRAELLKLRTTRTFVGFVLAALTSRCWRPS